MSASSRYRIVHETASRGYDRVTCWTQARAAVIPSVNSPLAVITMQKLRLQGSDDYEAIHSLHSIDGGRTWSTPIAQTGLGRRTIKLNGPDLLEEVPCDFWPKWHVTSGKILGTGHTACYTNGRILVNRPRSAYYSVYDAATHTWSATQNLHMPDADKFYNSGAGCTQRVDLENGEILLPVYFRYQDSGFATVVRCAFDGERLEYIEHGSELTIPVKRGFVEPSLAFFQGRYYLALRNDERNHLAVSDDGLNFGEPIPWRFDDGEELGSYNTQQHWVTRPGALYLVYTRRGLNNDHVFRHRAPLVMAQIDTKELRVIRDTEQAVIPERGARLGNFGITEAGDNETWVVEAEWMQNSNPYGQEMLRQLAARLPSDEVEQLAATPHLCGACEAFGSDNTVWVSRLLWE